MEEVLGLDTLTFTVPARPPFRLDLTVWALRRRPDNAVDRWDGGVYRRTLVLQGSRWRSRSSRRRRPTEHSFR